MRKRTSCTTSRARRALVRTAFARVQPFLPQEADRPLRNSADFHQTTTTGGQLGEARAASPTRLNRVVLPLTGDYAQNDHVLGHEMVHVFNLAHRATANQNRRRFALEAMPLWIVEGMADTSRRPRRSADVDVDPRRAIHDRMPDLNALRATRATSRTATGRR
jgi:hypothetical protein